MPADSPSGPAGSVKVVHFTLFGQPFQAMTAGPHHEFNDAISLMVMCEDQAKDEARARRVAEAMMNMVKLDAEALEKA